MNKPVNEAPHIPITLEEGINLESGAREIIRQIRPHWLTDSSNLTAKVFTDGITNKLIGYYLSDKPRDVVILKIYGPKTEELIDRKAELETINFLHSLGLGPALYAVFQNGIAYEFIPGKILNRESCKQADIFPAVARLTARLHSIELDEKNPLVGSSKHHSVIWEKIGTFIAIGDEILRTNSGIRDKYKAFGVEAGWGSREVKVLREMVESEGMPLVLCHNDLLLANIIYDAQTAKVSFIDYEYCGPNYAPFDIADHFAEFGGVEDADFSHCPDQDFQSAWIREYKAHFKGPSPTSQAQFESWVRLCMPLTHLFWILWTVVQSQNSTIDFDYIKYASIRVPEYERWMKIIREERSNKGH